LFLRYKLFFKLFFVWKNIKLIFKKNKLFWYANIKNLKNYFNIFLIKKIFLKTSCITISNKHCYHLYIVIYLFIYLAIWGFSLDLLAFYLPCVLNSIEGLKLKFWMVKIVSTATLLHCLMPPSQLLVDPIAFNLNPSKLRINYKLVLVVYWNKLISPWGVRNC
jgi:hypothetical protein